MKSNLEIYNEWVEDLETDPVPSHKYLYQAHNPTISKLLPWLKSRGLSIDAVTVKDLQDFLKENAQLLGKVTAPVALRHFFNWTSSRQYSGEVVLKGVKEKLKSDRSRVSAGLVHIVLASHTKMLQSILSRLDKVEAPTTTPSVKVPGKDLVTSYLEKVAISKPNSTSDGSLAKMKMLLRTYTSWVPNWKSAGHEEILSAIKNKASTMSIREIKQLHQVVSHFYQHAELGASKVPSLSEIIAVI